MTKRPVYFRSDNRASVQSLWDKYESIAMHFNDLLLKLRTQALAGVAALSTLIGLFAKSDSSSCGTNWELAGFVFAGLAIFWVAIWLIDFLYYNRLLMGAVAAIVALEEQSEDRTTYSLINMSRMIEDSVAGVLPPRHGRLRRLRMAIGRWAFYTIVLVALCSGAWVSFHMHCLNLTHT